MGVGFDRVCHVAALSLFLLILGVQVEFVADAKPWGVKADVALPCATQNEIELDDAKALVEVR